MKFKSFLLIPVAVVIVLMAANFPKNDVKKEDILLDAIMAGLRQLHYQPLEIDNQFSERVYNLYLERQDGLKRFYLQEDIKKLSKFKTQLDEATEEGTYEFLDLASSLFDKRIGQVQEIYQDVLSQPFDFSVNEAFETDPEKRTYPKNESELRDYWYKSLKYQAMTRFIDMKEGNEDKEEADQLTDAEMEAKVRKKILKDHEEWFHRMERMDRDDDISAYLNSITSAYDPHTNYYPPKDKEDFDIGMSGKFEGIGARLIEDGVYTKITSIIPGGPSYKQGGLEEGDLIIAVAQGEEEPINVIDMPTDEVVKYIRGKKGTEVRLTVKKSDGSTKIVSIIRDVVVIEESYAKSAIIEDEEFSGKKFGFIHLPKFYADFSDPKGRTCSKDIEQEVIKLKADNVDGIIIDLRFNGGGSLRDVVDMAGLFIEEGPIVQVKSRGEKPYVMRDKDASVLYDGPLVILVNQYSASASEILAAALQDYGRAVIVGTPSTFGKGTVQRFLDLDKVVPNSMSDIKPLGAVKMTIQKFYRINGTTTQLNGVTPDIVLPSPYAYMDLGEKEEKHPMEWDEIPAVSYDAMTNSQKMAMLQKQSASRISKSEAFNLIEKQAKFLKENREKTTVTLNIDKHEAEADEYAAESKKFKAINKKIEGISVMSLSKDKGLEVSEDRAASIKEWHKKITKDPQIDEALSIVVDMMN